MGLVRQTAALLSKLYHKVRQDGLKSALSSTFEFIRYKKNIYKVRGYTDNAIHICYNQERNELTELCDKYGTDKGELTPNSNPYPWESHNYTDFYNIIFNQRRRQVETLFECGIGTNNTDLPGHMGKQGKPGASLRVWRDFFPNAKIIGVDIDEEIMFSENRIETFCVDQTSEESISQFLNSVELDGFDIMIDDGLHEYHANITLFENMASYLNEDGIYIIEDVSYHNLDNYKKYFIDELDSYHARFVEIENSRISGKDRIIMITPN